MPAARGQSFQEDADEEIDATENEEDWIDYIKRSTNEAEEHMEKHNVKCWIEAHRRLKWRMARRIITLPEKYGTEEYSAGTLDWTTTSKQEDKSVDPNEVGKTTSTNL